MSEAGKAIREAIEQMRNAPKLDGFIIMHQYEIDRLGGIDFVMDQFPGYQVVAVANKLPVPEETDLAGLNRVVQAEAQRIGLRPPPPDFYDDIAGVAGAGMYLPCNPDPPRLPFRWVVEPDPAEMAVDFNARPYAIAAVVALIVILAIWFTGA